MGYKKPDDVGAVSGLLWHVVAIPDDPAYRTAALGALTDMAHSWRWGMDEPEDADNALIRQHWLDAIDATMEAHEMGFPDLVIGFIDDIETLLAEMKNLGGGCCPENVTYFPVPVPTDPGYDYDGETFPDPWGESETPSDADDWRELVCGAAHAYMDYLVAIGAELDALVITGTVIVAALASILGLLSGAGILMAVSYGSVAGIVTAMIAGATESIFGDASDDLETERDNIICAMLQFDGEVLSDAIEAAVSTLAWTLFFQWIDYESAIRILQTGEFDSSYLPIVRSTDCDCPYVPVAGMNEIPATFTDFSVPRTTFGQVSNAADMSDGKVRLWGTTSSAQFGGKYTLGFDQTDYEAEADFTGFTVIPAATKIEVMISPDAGEFLRLNGNIYPNIPTVGETIVHYVQNGTYWPGYDWDAEADTAVNLAAGDDFPGVNQNCILGSNTASVERDVTWRVTFFVWLIPD